MPKAINLEEIASKNPRVDLQALEEGRTLRKNLRQIGGAKERPLTTPTERRRVKIDDSVASDPRTVRLQRCST